MRRRYYYVLAALFLLTFLIAMTAAIWAAGGAGQRQYICCTYTNQCGYIGYGAELGGICDCVIPGGGQGWEGGCLFACPANCSPP